MLLLFVANLFPVVNIEKCFATLLNLALDCLIAEVSTMHCPINLPLYIYVVTKVAIVVDCCCKNVNFGVGNGCNE